VSADTLVDLGPSRRRGNAGASGELDRPETAVAPALPGDDSLKDRHVGHAGGLEQARGVDRCALDQVGTPKIERGVGERVLEIDHEDGRPLAGLDGSLAVTPLHPGIAGRKLERHGA
jgi:hypothetical protein